MELNRVIVAYKRTLKQPRTKRERASASAKRLKASADRYQRALDTVMQALRDLDIPFSVTDRTKLKPPHYADLIVSVGGDGTVLICAHRADDTPILAVNFMPQRSVGFFCAATPKDFKKRMVDISRGKLIPVSLPLLAVTIDGKDLGLKALNEVLFASPCPAEMSRYKLTVGRRSEAQRSSGVWVSAGPGSTAAIASAGGRKMPIQSNRLQYLVREPCPLPGQRYRLIKGIVPAGTRVAMTSDMSNAVAYLDGTALSVPIPRGATLAVRAVPDALKLYL